METTLAALVLLLVLVLAILWIRSLPQPSLSLEFERMNLEWRYQGSYTDLNGNLRYDVDGIIDAYLELKAQGQNSTTDSIIMANNMV
jgi:hypothetical protein